MRKMVTLHPTWRTVIKANGKDRIFFLGLTFHVNRTFKTWGKSLQLQYANEAKLYPNMVLTLVSDHLQ